MSIFGAMTTAISGLTSQATAFSNIGDNLANSQTVGYKAVGTNFDDYVTTSTVSVNGSDAVVAQPDYQNTLQGSISQTDSSLNLAISGNGFFPVSTASSSSNNVPVFDESKLYTREGDFQMDSQGYLVNSTGHYLNGWPVDANGNVDATQLVPLQVGQSGYAPIATSSASIAANLPATPSSSAPVTTELPVVDAEGTSRNLELTWTPTATPNTWSLSIAQEGSATVIGSANVTFGPTGTAPAASASAPEGTISAVTATTGTGSTYTTGSQATLGITADFGLGNQPISLDLGTWGGTDGLTQFAGTNYNLVSVSQNGVKPGSFSGVSMQSNGDVVVNYDNGSSRVVAQIPVVTFPSPDSLERKDGQAFQETSESGTARVQAAASNGAGTLVTSSLESSNVDIATEFSKLIVAQRAYSANTKMVTTADDMLEQTIDMKR